MMSPPSKLDSICYNPSQLLVAFVVAPSTLNFEL
jgi:hypothetical protein